MIRKDAGAEGLAQSRGGVHGEAMGMKKLLLHCLHWFCVNKKKKEERRKKKEKEKEKEMKCSP